MSSSKHSGVQYGPDLNWPQFANRFKAYVYRKDKDSLEFFDRPPSTNVSSAEARAVAAKEISADRALWFLLIEACPEAILQQIQDGLADRNSTSGYLGWQQLTAIHRGSTPQALTKAFWYFMDL